MRTNSPATVAATGYTMKDNDVIMVDAEVQNQYVMRVRDLPVAEKPREKLLAYGPADLTMAELVAVLLGVGTRREEVLVMARRIIKEYGERAIIHESNPERLSESLRIPVAKACQLIAAFELGRRMFDVRAGQPVYVRSADDAYVHLKGMATLQKEQLRGLYMNSRYHVIHEEVISVGSLTANIVHPREVFRPAIECGAVAVIVAHNHPSGVLEATEADIDVTRQLVATGKIIGIDLLDHIIVSDAGYKSIINER